MMAFGHLDGVSVGRTVRTRYSAGEVSAAGDRGKVNLLIIAVFGE
jgi:hypothetical protein